MLLLFYTSKSTHFYHFHNFYHTPACEEQFLTLNFC